MDLTIALHNRRSVRAYTQQQIEQDTIKKLLEAATWAPSAGNSQPWAFGIIHGKEKLEKISTEAKAYLLAHMTENQMLVSYSEALKNPKFNIFYGAPSLIIVYGNNETPFPTGDAAMAAQNLMLTAYDNGLGTCWIAFALALINSEDFKKRMNIPANMSAVAPIIVGYPERQSPMAQRKPPVILFE